MNDQDRFDIHPNPGEIAAAGPEPPDLRSPVFAVGIGPGGREYLTPRARRVIETGDVVVGFETVIGYVDDLIAGDALACSYRDEAETLRNFAEAVADGADGVALSMGDPNHSGYQFIGKVEAVIDRPVRIVPGVSSVQVAASRARTPMEDTTFVTLHKSGGLRGDLERLRRDVGERHLLVLPRPYDWMPEDIAAELLEAGASGGLEALVLERLTHDDESITRTTLSSLAEGAGGSDPDDTAFSDLSVLAVRTH